MRGFFLDAEGNLSMMRLLAFLGLILGAGVAVWGLVLLTMTINAVLDGHVTAAGMIGSLVLLVGGGLGLAGGGEVLKMLQQRSEAKGR